MSVQKRYRMLMTACIIALAVTGLLALCMGQYRIPVRVVLSELTGKESGIANVHNVIFQIRLPRILLSMLAGAGLAAAGLAFQSMFANPLATPDTLGTANGASFGAALGILMGFSSGGVQVCALIFGVLAVFLVFLVTSRPGGSGHSMIMIILAGMVVSSLFSALVSLTKYVADPQDQLPVITFWLMGSFSGVTRNSLLIGMPLIIAGIIIIYLLRFRLNALSLSEDEARALGINLPLTRALVIGSAAAITASVVSICGVIGWVGLLIPHISRMILGNDNRRSVPSSIALGALFMVIVDTVARCATASEIPVSILTAVIGAPVFILLLRKTGGIKT